jgi:DNA recombination-dependent growth factor C
MIVVERPPGFAFARPEGPAVLRLRMLELGHTLRLRALDAAARADAEATLARLREAVLSRPVASLADALARARTCAEATRRDTP